MPSAEKTVEEPLVKVASASNEALAGMWAEFLERKGIRCLVRSAGPGAPYPTAPCEHHLYVLARNKRRAVQLLRPYAGSKADLTLSEAGPG